MTDFKIVNRLQYSYAESNLVYPLDKGYYYIAKLDEHWIKEKLLNIGCIDIHNKYAVVLNVNNGSEILVTNHDGEYWLTSK